MKKWDKKKEDNPDVRLSKTISWLLRHGAQQEGIKIRADGYVLMHDLLEYLATQKGMKNIDRERIMQIVENNDKKRFEVKKEINPENELNEWWIRAAQGHTIAEVKTEDLLQKIEDPREFPVVIHGTYSQFWPLIEKEGMKRMTRNHMHFAPGYPKQEGVISGMRGSCDIIIEIDMESAMKDGIKFYISSNKVILTEGIEGVLPTKYFKRVTEKKTGKILMEV